MPTNSLRPGMCNVPVNMMVEERSILGRLAFSEDMSTGAFVRRLIKHALAIEHPAAVEELEAARRRRKAGVLLALVIWSVCLSWFGGDDETFRKAGKQRPKTVRVDKNGREVEVA